MLEKLFRKYQYAKNQKKKLCKKPVKQTLRLFKGNLMIPNNILEPIITDPDLKHREVLILILILRLTNGLNRYSCILSGRDFEVIGIRETHIGRYIKKLVQTEWITVRPLPSGDKTYCIHKKRWLNNLRNEKLSNLIYKKITENGNHWR